MIAASVSTEVVVPGKRLADASRRAALVAGRVNAGLGDPDGHLEHPPTGVVGSDGELLDRVRLDEPQDDLVDDGLTLGRDAAGLPSRMERKASLQLSDPSVHGMHAIPPARRRLSHFGHTAL